MNKFIENKGGLLVYFHFWIPSFIGALWTGVLTMGEILGTEGAGVETMLIIGLKGEEKLPFPVE